MSKKAAQAQLLARLPRNKTVVVAFITPTLLLAIVHRHGMPSLFHLCWQVCVEEDGDLLVYRCSPPPKLFTHTGNGNSVKHDYDYDQTVPICPKGWVLEQSSSSMRDHVEETNAKWYDALPGFLRQMHNAHAQKDPDGVGYGLTS